MRLIVLGANGRLGHRLVPHLRKAGYAVTSHGRAPGNDEHGDLCDRKVVEDLLLRTVPDVIVNLAAFTSVDGCELNPQKAFDENVLIPFLLASSRNSTAKSPSILQISSDQVYSGPGPHVEGRPAPSNVYGYSKYCGEMALGVADVCILRTNFVGRSEAPGSPSLTDWLYSSLLAKRRIEIFEDIYFSPLSMRSLCEAVQTAIRKGLRGVFNVGSRDGTSKAEFAESFASACNLDLSPMVRVRAETRMALVAKRPSDMRMDTSKFELSTGTRLPCLQDEIKQLAGEYRDSQ